MIVLIEGMDMPKNCHECPICMSIDLEVRNARGHYEHENCICAIDGENGSGYLNVTKNANDRHPKCPLVECKGISLLSDAVYVIDGRRKR